MRFAESKRFRIALACKLVDNRSAGITQTHYLGTFINGFTCGIIDCLPQDFHVIVSFHQNNLGISTGNQQAKERKLRLHIIFTFRFNEMS